MDNSRYEIFVGKVFDGRYKILELVGVGGMAFVLKAEDMVMNRIVAIKILNEEYNGDEQAEQRFINESKAVAMLSHKNIVNIYDVAIYPDIYFPSEYPPFYYCCYILFKINPKYAHIFHFAFKFLSV